MSSHTVVPHKSSVTVAGGDILYSKGILHNVSWHIDNHEFISDFKILPLAHFDIILGMDWLEQFSPMQVHWKQKWVKITFQGQSITLFGITSGSAEKFLLQVCCAIIEETQLDMSSPLPEIQSLIESFKHLFQPPVGLPPKRACDHVIPLVPEASTVAIRPYRYPPKLKDEMEKQVNDMLEQGIIQPSKSLFSSPVLLVPKKDGSYRFCVDFRQLNALTVKSKFPVPIFDQLMDELASAKWFTTLDLRAGFHQILLQSGEEPKTAFQTHLGSYEFKVMAFGLTGAPGTFQGAMNSTLAPGLRKFVLVFFDDILVYSSSYEEHLFHLAQVFQWLSKDQWKLKFSKCKFAQ